MTSPQQQMEYYRTGLEYIFGDGRPQVFLVDTYGIHFTYPPRYGVPKSQSLSLGCSYCHGVGTAPFFLIKEMVIMSYKKTNSYDHKDHLNLPNDHHFLIARLFVGKPKREKKKNKQKVPEGSKSHRSLCFTTAIDHYCFKISLSLACKRWFNAAKNCTTPLICHLASYSLAHGVHSVPNYVKFFLKPEIKG